MEQQFPFVARIFEFKTSNATNIYFQMAKLVKFTPLPADEASDRGQEDDELDGETCVAE